MRVLFAVSNSENSKDDIVDVILNEYQKQYKKIVSYKRAFYYDAIVNEIKQTRDNRYDVIVISEDLEKNINDSYEAEDANLYKHLDEITDEAYKEDGTGIPIILICSDRRSERDPIISQLFVLGIYNILTGKRRTIQNVCALLDKPRNKKNAKILYNIAPKDLKYTSNVSNSKIISDKELFNILNWFNRNKEKTDKCVKGFAKLVREYNEEQLQTIINKLPLNIKIILEENSKEYMKIAKISVKDITDEENKPSVVTRDLSSVKGVIGTDVIIPGQNNKKGILKKPNGKN
ncbi:MAG: hypothetical protein J6A89_09180 [Clostridia bacterium]|nr:hypothetical protein [Clostridia bacterium]